MRPDPNKAFYIMGGVVRKRFDDELIDHLLELKWCDWPMEKIGANFKASSSGDLSLIRKINR